MLFKASGNVKDLLIPQCYSKRVSKVRSQLWEILIFKVQTSQIGDVEKTRAEKPSRLVSSIPENLEYVTPDVD